MTPEEIEELPVESCIIFLKKRFRFEDDEIKTLFKTDAKIRNAVKDALKLSDSKIDADELKSAEEDETELTDVQKTELKRLKEETGRAQEERARWELEKTGADISPKELVKTKSGIAKLLSEGLDEDKEDDDED
jgi:hypothetical protein